MLLTQRSPKVSTGVALSRLLQGSAPALLIGLLSVATASAQALLFQYSGTGGTVVNNVVAVTELQYGWAVTVAQNSSNNQLLTVWNDTGSALVKKGHVTGSGVTAVHITDLDATRVVTAVIDSATSEMQLAVWKVTLPAGTIAQQGAPMSVSGTASSVSIATLDSGHVATAAVIGGNLQVNVFDISSTGVITDGGSATGGSATLYAHVVVVSPSQFVSAVGNSTKNLEVTSWGISGSTVSKQGSATAGVVQRISAAYYSTNVYTAVENNSGNLELLEWGVSTTGSVVKQATGTVGAASRVAVCGVGVAGPVTAVIGSSGDLDLAAWNNGPTLSQLETYVTYNSSTAVTQVAVTPYNNIEYFLTAVRTSAGKLQVSLWWYSPPPPMLTH